MDISEMEVIMDNNNYQWYPGHMAKAFKIMKEDIALVDIVIEVVDARAPESTRNPNLLDLTKGKGHILVLNKSDMADDKESSMWLDYYKENGVCAILLNSKKQSDVLKIKDTITQLMEEKYKGKSRDYKRIPRVMICGVPNVGKSTFINSFVGKKSAKTGNRPGVTIGKQWIKVGNTCELLDTPGVLYVKPVNEKSGQRLAFLGSLNDNNLNIENLAFFLIEWMMKRYPDRLSEKYSIETDGETLEIFDNIARRLGALKKGGKLDYERAAKVVIDDYRNGRFGKMTLERPWID